jgi:hypothetical protein
VLEQALAEFREASRVRGTRCGSGGRPDPRDPRPGSEEAHDDRQPELYALERQRQRIQARLDAPPDAPPVRIQAPPSAERIQAEAQVNEAQREVNSANRELEDARTRFTDKHPTSQKAQDRLTMALQRLRQAQAAVPPEVETVVARRPPKIAEAPEGSAKLDSRSSTSRARQDSDACDRQTVGSPFGDRAHEAAACRRSAREWPPPTWFAPRWTPNQKAPRRATPRWSILRSPRIVGARQDDLPMAGMVLSVAGFALAIACGDRRPAVSPQRSRPARHRTLA